MKRVFSFSLLFLFTVVSFSGFATVRLPAIIGSHMVLQQQSEVKIWGWCEPGEKISIKVSWDTTTYRATGNSNAKWSLNIKTGAAGGPYKISIAGHNTIELDDVMLGEVWVCSGQSNMEMSYNWGLKQYTDEMNNASNNSMRLFHIPRLTADHPQDDTKGKWVVCNPEDAKNFSSIGYFFGKHINEALNVPVGLVNASWGGTPAEVWTPKEVVDNNVSLKAAADSLKPASGWPIRQGLTYNAMISPIANYNIAGAIWYQGETNTGTSYTYQQLFTSMIGAWRKAWNKQFPFYYVQLAPYTYGNNNIGALLREAQTKSLSCPKTGMVVTSDLVDNINDIHPKLKKEVGLRLANLALADTYGKAISGYNSPVYKSMKIENDKILIYFNNVEDGLVIKGSASTEFYIAGDDKNFVPAQAKISGNTVIVSNKSVKNPVAVRFAFSNTAMPNLYSKAGLPVNLFRTDDWPVSTEAIKK
jgi:sialate O-acetylesterase